MESPQESVLWSTPIPYINDLNGAATHSKVHHFADDTTMLFYQFYERCKQKGQLWFKIYFWMIKDKQNFFKFRQNRTYSF